jgi:hypothetical protein
MITTRAEMLHILRQPRVMEALVNAGEVSPDVLADLMLEAAGMRAEQPVGERWDAVESTLTRLGIRASGHVGRCPILPLTAWEYMLMRLTSGEAALAPPGPLGYPGA